MRGKLRRGVFRTVGAGLKPAPTELNQAPLDSGFRQKRRLRKGLVRADPRRGYTTSARSSSPAWADRRARDTLFTSDGGPWATTFR